MKFWMKCVGFLTLTAGLSFLIKSIQFKLAKLRIAKEISLNPSTLLITGRRISKTEVARLEAVLDTNPEDLHARGLLLGYYWQPFAGPAIAERFETHSLWVIEHYPDHPLVKLCRLNPDDGAEAYERGKESFLRHCEKRPEDIDILKNAAQYFLIFDRELAESLLQKAKASRPNDYTVANELAQVYHLGLDHLGDDENSKRALEEQERALELSSEPRDLIYTLLDLPDYAFKAGALEKASSYSWRLLNEASKEKSFAATTDGDAMHRAHTILGRIALAKGDVEQAKLHLTSSADVVPSPVLKSFGPKFELAHALVKLGESECVIAYLNRCAEFWTNNNGRLAQWRSEISKGIIPSRWVE